MNAVVTDGMMQEEVGLRGSKISSFLSSFFLPSKFAKVAKELDAGTIMILFVAFCLLFSLVPSPYVPISYGSAIVLKFFAYSSICMIYMLILAIAAVIVANAEMEDVIRASMAPLAPLFYYAAIIYPLSIVIGICRIFPAILSILFYISASNAVVISYRSWGKKGPAIVVASIVLTVIFFYLVVSSAISLANLVPRFSYSVHYY